MFMKRPLYILSFICSLYGMLGCITDYVPSGIKEVSDILVVESTITNDTTYVRLTRSLGLLDQMRKLKTINNAVVSVETADGSFKKEGKPLGNGNYAIVTGELNFSTEYRLLISADGEEYASGFLAPLSTPEMDTLSWQKRGPGEPVYICVSSHGDKNQSPYYRWTYQEDWEVKAELLANGGYGESINGIKQIVEYGLNTSNNTYYCWGRDSSKVLLLDSSEKLRENIISNKKLIEIPPSDDRLSILYHITVHQTSLRNEAYLYFHGVEKNMNQTAGLFSAMPSELRGNITCLSNPEIPVIGYVEVGTTTEKKIFIPTSKEIYEPEKSWCTDMITDEEHISLFLYDINIPRLYAPGKCVNCLFKRKATKNKPAWWPTSHL